MRAYWADADVPATGCTAALTGEPQMSQLRLRNIRQSAMSGERDARLWLMMNPAVENALSDGTEVAEIHKYFCASVASFGKRALLSRQ